MGRTFTNLHMRRTEMKNSGTLCGGSDSPLWEIDLRSVGPGETKAFLADEHPCKRCDKARTAKLKTQGMQGGKKAVAKPGAKVTAKPAAKSKPTPKTKPKTKAAATKVTRPKTVQAKKKAVTSKSKSKPKMAATKSKIRPRTSRERTKPKTTVTGAIALPTPIPPVQSQPVDQPSPTAVAAA